MAFLKMTLAVTLIGLVAAGDYDNHDGGHIGDVHGGVDNSVNGYGHEEQHYAPQPYKFGYKVNEEWGQQHREEQADGHGNVVGSYGFTDANGIYRQVNYIADKFGFRAQIKTNEPGTAKSSPADAHFESSAPQPEAHYGSNSGHGHYADSGDSHHGLRA